MSRRKSIVSGAMIAIGATIAAASPALADHYDRPGYHSGGYPPFYSRSDYHRYRYAPEWYPRHGYVWYQNGWVLREQVRQMHRPGYYHRDHHRHHGDRDWR